MQPRSSPGIWNMTELRPLEGLRSAYWRPEEAEDRLATTERLITGLPGDIVVVGESGIHERADVERLAAAGVDAVLVGESLVRADDAAAAVERLAGVARTGRGG